MKVSTKGALEIAEHEGIVPAPYLDSAGVWTWGGGHTHAAAGSNPAMIQKDMPDNLNAAVDEAVRVFAVDLASYEARVNKAVKVPLKQHEFDALVSFDFNTGGIHRANLTKHLNAGNRTKAAQAFMGWLRPPELRKRRTAEMNLFITGNYDGNGDAIPVWKTNGKGKLIGVAKTLRGKDITKRLGIRIGYAPALAYRVTYVGELGWELYIPTEYMEYVYETLISVGEPEGMINMGYHAVDSLRLEKRFLAWGGDITPDYNPFEAGLSFLIDWKKGDFIGRAALAQIKTKGVNRKLVSLLLEENLSVFGDEAVYADGKVVAQTTSGNFAYSLGKPIALAYLPTCIDIKTAAVEVQSFDRKCRATVVEGTPYDAQRTKNIR